MKDKPLWPVYPATHCQKELLFYIKHFFAPYFFIKRKNIKRMLILTIVLSITISTMHISAIENIDEEKSYPVERIFGCKNIRKVSQMDNQKLVEKEDFHCIVHKGSIVGANLYVCPTCKAIYCLNCVKSLYQDGINCWVCSKPFKLNEV